MPHDARAEDLLGKVQRRIESTFDLVVGNAADLAIPLTRRALARRSEEGSEKPFDALSYSDAQPSAAPAFAAVSPETANPPAQAWSDGIEVARLPRPRPRQDEGAPVEQGSADAADGAPIDLVAGAPAPPPKTKPLEPPKEPVTVASIAAPAVIEPPPAPPAPTAVSDLAAAASEAVDDPVAMPATTESVDLAAVASEAVDDPAATPATTGSTDLTAAAPAADEPILPAQPAAPVAPELVAAGACLSPGDVSDKDGDFKRNAKALSAGGFCIAEEKFKERRRPWTLQTIKTGRPGPLWAVMHDDEDLSFDIAVAALAQYGGTLVTVDTGGKRNQDGIDPNRNFSADGIGCSKLGNDAAPRYTAFFRALMSSEPIIALHNNYDGHIPTGGLGHASMKSAGKDMRAVPAADPKSPLASQYSLVLLVADADQMDKAQQRARALAAKGINAMIETVRGKGGDCSLSNYALLTGHDDYLNVTVNYDEGDRQRKIIDTIMGGRNDTVATQ